MINFLKRKKTNIIPDLDIDYYLSKYPDVVGEPAEHYRLFGKKEGRYKNAIEESKDLEKKIDKFDMVKEDLDIKFYQSYYDDLKIMSNEELILHWKKYGKKENRISNLSKLLRKFNFNENIINILDLNLIKRINTELNQLDDINIYLYILQIKSVNLIRLSNNLKFDATFYYTIAKSYISQGDNQKGIELLLYSINIFPISHAYELLGNHYLNYTNNIYAIEFYNMALLTSNHNSNSKWLYINLAEALEKEKFYVEALNILSLALKNFPLDSFFLQYLDKAVKEYWNYENTKLQALGMLDQRDRLIDKTNEIVERIAFVYRKIFNYQKKEKSISINKKNILIIGDFSLSQCFHYRIEQKTEQLKYANYNVKQISWTELQNQYEEIFLHDIIIYYRVPSFPIIIRSIEQAKALNKIVCYEIDDLIFDKVYPSSYETYGGNISIEEYGGLTYGMPLFRNSAKLCDYAIASTMPLFKELEPLVRRKKAFLHRNGLDKYNIHMKHTDKSYINIFYGSGTLAHNSDFIELALDAIDKILEENNNVKLTIVGYLTLPKVFIEKHKTQLVLLEKTSTIEEYWNYLKGADINLAVLESNIINDGKSELKWFEAACFKIPSVVSNTKNYLDVIEDKKDALVASTPQEWYDSLNQLIKDENLRNIIGNDAFHKVVKNYSIKALSQNIDNIIKEMIQDKGQDYE